jgi:hypothetical protein
VDAIKPWPIEERTPNGSENERINTRIAKSFFRQKLEFVLPPTSPVLGIMGAQGVC